jgi:hypothetical protein
MIRRWFITVGAGFVVVVAAVILISGGRGEPRYKDRALSDWIDDAENVRLKSLPGYDHEEDPKWQAASNAVYQIGTNAIPALVKWAFARDSKPKAAVIKWLNAHPSLHIHVRNTNDWFGAASTGFEMLGNKIAPAWPMIEERTYDNDAGQRLLALVYLLDTRPDHHRDNPLLFSAALRLCKDTNNDVQRVAASILRDLFPEKAEVAGVFKLYPNLTNLVPAGSVTNQALAK